MEATALTLHKGRQFEEEKIKTIKCHFKKNKKKTKKQVLEGLVSMWFYVYMMLSNRYAQVYSIVLLFPPNGETWMCVCVLSGPPCVFSTDTLASLNRDYHLPPPPTAVCQGITPAFQCFISQADTRCLQKTPLLLWTLQFCVLMVLLFLFLLWQLWYISTRAQYTSVFKLLLIKTLRFALKGAISRSWCRKRCCNEEDYPIQSRKHWRFAQVARRNVCNWITFVKLMWVKVWAMWLRDRNSFVFYGRSKNSLVVTVAPWQI